MRQHQVQEIFYLPFFSFFLSEPCITSLYFASSTGTAVMCAKRLINFKVYLARCHSYCILESQTQALECEQTGSLPDLLDIFLVHAVCNVKYQSAI